MLGEIKYPLMIFDDPKNWQDLQEKVSTILNQVGFDSTTNKVIKTPRGEVEIDVYAVDPYSIDKIIYVIECKNWQAKIPQTIIHSFTTVMSETGANVGYIISKEGFQKGAYDYTNYTSIINLTFKEFQNKYSKMWAGNYFNFEIKQHSDSLIQYTEPINSRRERFFSGLGTEEKKIFIMLKEKYFLFASLLNLTCQNVRRKGLQHVSFEAQALTEIEEFKGLLEVHSGVKFTSTCYAELLTELKMVIQNITNEFNTIFGKDIFADYN